MSARKRLLLIEDEQDYCENIADFLRQESFEVITAANGSEGLEQFVSHKPDLVLSDIQMPQLSGLEMLEKMNQQHSHQIGKTPFVFLTAWGDKQYCTSAKTLGCDDFLQKPVDFDMLLTTLHGKLNKWQKVESSFEHDHEMMQHILLQTMNQRIRKPINSMLSYAQIMESLDTKTYHTYVKRLDDMARQQLSVSQCLTDALSLNQKLYALDEKLTNPANALWECAASVFGFDAAAHITVECSPTNWHHHALMDQHLCYRMFRLWLEILSPSTCDHRSIPAVSCKATRHQRIEITLESHEKPIKDTTSQWLMLHDLGALTQQPELLHRYGCELLFSHAVCVAHDANMIIKTNAHTIACVRWSFPMK